MHYHFYYYSYCCWQHRNTNLKTSNITFRHRLIEPWPFVVLFDWTNTDFPTQSRVVTSCWKQIIVFALFCPLNDHHCWYRVIVHCYQFEFVRPELHTSWFGLLGVIAVSDNCHIMDPSLLEMLECQAAKLGLDITSKELALSLDNDDPVQSLRKLFHYPKMKDLPEG